MTKSHTLRLCFALAFLMAGITRVVPVFAQDGPAASGTAEAEIEPVVDPKLARQAEELREDINKLLAEIAEGLDADEQKHFYLVYNNYNLIGTVKMVQGDVGNAIDACSKENPDMEKDLRARYTAWNDVVNPIITEADAHLNNMVFAQEYAKPAKIREVFKGIDGTREIVNKQIEKTPVTTPDACQYLLEKMDDTEKSMAALLRQTLISIPQAFPETQVAPKPGDGEL